MKIDTKSWGNKPIKNFSRWEQREIYSYQDINERDTNLELVNKIVQAVDNSSDLVWSSDDLDLISEALIQKKLRDKNNIEIKSWKLDNFPISIAELKSLFNYSTASESKTKIRFDFYTHIKLAKLLDYKNTFLTIIIITGLIYFQCDLLGWALLLTWVISNLVFLNLHEKWSHGYIHAKNKFLNIILDIISYLFLTKLPIIEKIDLENMYKDHLLHHKYWQTSNDMVDYTLKNNNLFTFIFGDPKYFSNDTNYKSIRKTNYGQTNIEARFINQHQQIIVIFLHLLLLVLLGFKYYFYFVVLQIWFANIYNRLFIEYIPHKLLKNKQDIPILIPFVGTSAALHNEHHIRNTHLLDDHGLLRKYLNPHYYLTKLFFKLA